MKENEEIKEVEAKIIHSLNRQGLGPIRKALREEPFKKVTKIPLDEYYKKVEADYDKAIIKVIKNPPPSSDFFVVLDREGRYIYWAVDEFFKMKGIKTPQTLFLKTRPLMDALENILLTILMENPKTNLLKNLKIKLFDPAEAKGIPPNDAVWSYKCKQAKDLEFSVEYSACGKNVNVCYSVGKNTVMKLMKDIRRDGNKTLAELFPKEFYDIAGLIQKHLGQPYQLEEDEISYIVNLCCKFKLSPKMTLKELYDKLSEGKYKNGLLDTEKLRDGIYTLEARRRGDKDANFKISSDFNVIRILRHFSNYSEVRNLMRKKIESLIGDYSNEFFISLKKMIKEKGKVNVTLIDASICDGKQLTTTELLLHILFGKEIIECKRYVPTAFGEGMQFGDCEDYGNFNTQYLTYKGMKKVIPHGKYKPEAHEKIVRSVFRYILKQKQLPIENNR